MAEENSGSSVVRRSNWKRNAHAALTTVLMDMRNLGYVVESLEEGMVESLVKAGDQMFGKAADWDEDVEDVDGDDDDED